MEPRCSHEEAPIPDVGSVAPAEAATRSPFLGRLVFVLGICGGGIRHITSLGKVVGSCAVGCCETQPIRLVPARPQPRSRIST